MNSLSPPELAELDALLYPPTNAASELEAKGWRAWYAEIFGPSFVETLDSSETDDRHHSEAIEWHWNTRRTLIRIEIEALKLDRQLRAGIISQVERDTRLAAFNEERRLLSLAYFTIWARGNLKTTIARRVAVCDACLSASAGVGGYALIVGGTKAKVRGTANSINGLLTKPLTSRGSEVWRYYPKLAEVKRNKFGHSQGWTTDLIVTDANYTFHFTGLDEGMAGANEEDVRPTFILPDDIDNRKDSPVIADRNFQTFTSEILPMRQWNTLVFYAQNLISKFSTIYRIWKQLARVLTNRVVTDPIPAVRDLVTKVETVNGIVKDVFISGHATWREWSKPGRIQDEIDTYGLPAFKRECQHEVEESREGLVMQHWRDEIHVISRSQFAAVFKVRDIPREWYKYNANDWARTKTAYHANVDISLAVSAQNSALPGCVFAFHPLSFPAGTAAEDVAERILSKISPYVSVNGQRWKWKDLVESTLRKHNLEYFISEATALMERRRELLAKVIPNLVKPILAAQNYLIFRNSHEREDVRGVMRRVFGLPVDAANPGGDGGVDTLNLLMRVDENAPHPFKSMQGYTNFYIVVPDDESRSVADEVYEPKPYPDALRPDDLHDEDLFRYQMANCRYRDPWLTAQGEKEGEILKMNDDFVNALMMLVHDNVLSARPLTYREQVTEMIPVQHRVETMLANSPNGISLTPEQELTAIINIEHAKKKIVPQRVRFDEWGKRI